MSFTTLEIARNTLTASRVAMDVAAQNVANANTPGYVRQRAVLTPLVNASGAGVGVGTGVSVAIVERLRDRCLETQINHQEGQLGSQRSLAASMQRVETAFPDLDGNGIAAALEETFDALSRLQTDPDSGTGRSEVLACAQNFCDQLQEAASQLDTEVATLDQQVSESVSRVNELLQRVADLNARTVSAGSSGAANDLCVAREEAIRELAGLCGAMGLDQANGTQDVLIGGVRLVQGTSVTPLSLSPSPTDPTRSQVATGGLTDLQDLGGEIAGCLQARDAHLAEWHDHLDQLASGVADRLNEVHRQGFNLQGQSGGDLFTYDPAHPAATLKLSAAIVADPSLLAASSQAQGTAGDGANAAALAAVRSEDLFTGGTQTAMEFHGALLAGIGAASARAEESVSARKLMVESLDTQYANQAGVSLDDEAVDVMRFRQAYNAALKLTETALQMMDSLLQIAG